MFDAHLCITNLRRTRSFFSFGECTLGKWDREGGIVVHEIREVCVRLRDSLPIGCHAALAVAFIVSFNVVPFSGLVL